MYSKTLARAAPVERQRNLRLRRHPDLRVVGLGLAVPSSTRDAGDGDVQAQTGGPDDDSDVGAQARRRTARSRGCWASAEGAVRYQIKRMGAGAVDGRSRQEMRAAKVGAAIEHWREQHAERSLNLAALHEWLIAEHGYRGSLRSVQRYWRRNLSGAGAAGTAASGDAGRAQSQVDWAHFPGLIVGGERIDLLALHMVLSHSRYEAVVWSPQQGPAVVAGLPHRGLQAPGRGERDGAGRQREDGDHRTAREPGARSTRATAAMRL